MLTNPEHNTMAEASADLLDFVLAPENWVVLSELSRRPEKRPGQNPAYQRTVGALKICASVDVTPGMEVFLRIAFRGPGLTPTKAADHLADFLTSRIPLTRNSEWQVQVDEKGWTHFIRRYSGATLTA